MHNFPSCFGCIVLTAAAMNASPTQAITLADRMIQEFRETKDEKPNQKLNELIMESIREVPNWERASLLREYTALWRAAQEEKGEWLQAAFLGSATAFLVQSQYGSDIARGALPEMLDALEHYPPRSQVMLTQGLSRLVIRGIAEKDLTRMVKLAFAVEPFAGSTLIAMVAKSDPENRVLREAILGILDASAATAASPADLSKVQAFLGAVSNGTDSLGILEVLERAAKSKEPTWRSGAIEALQKSLSKQPDVVKRILSGLEANSRE